jgi:hypothetical protein
MKWRVSRKRSPLVCAFEYLEGAVRAKIEAVKIGTAA